jgi:hypothetical protein
MRRYLVQRCDEDGKAKGAPLEIYAASEIKAAEIATRMKLRPRGKSREVRARVSRAGQASPPTPFFASPPQPSDLDQTVPLPDDRLPSGLLQTNSII